MISELISLTNGIYYNNYVFTFDINRLVVAIVLYFVVGMIIMRVKFEKTGSDIIPNKTFWTSLPFLVKVKHCVMMLQTIRNNSILHTLVFKSSMQINF